MSEGCSLRFIHFNRKKRTTFPLYSIRKRGDLMMNELINFIVIVFVWTTSTAPYLYIRHHGRVRSPTILGRGRTAVRPWHLSVGRLIMEPRGIPTCLWVEHITSIFLRLTRYRHVSGTFLLVLHFPSLTFKFVDFSVKVVFQFTELKLFPLRH